MPVFYRQAYEAACRGVIPPGLSDEDFEAWDRLEPVLALLPTDAQRCDAVYGNWLMRLHNPGGRQLLEQRAHLIGDGALDANYLAELAQNANDAAGGEGAELRVALYGDWLLVANNGRKVSPLNLNGLCDFFGHFAPPVTGIRTIGRFGVGFKSSFRIADEIFIVSWDSDSGQFCFRLPISRPDRPPSFPDADTASRVIGQLDAVGVRVGTNLAFPEIGGYCTPEAQPELPPVIPGVEVMRRDFERGTLFCFHICPAVRAEVESRIHEQEHRIYELCPLFLPALNIVRIGECQLRLIRHRPVDQNEGILLQNA